jgi:hypothetical protein
MPWMASDRFATFSVNDVPHDLDPHGVIQVFSESVLMNT